MTEEEWKVKVKKQDRTKAQCKAIELKYRGYNVIRVLNDFGDTVAFAYKKESIINRLNLKDLDESHFDFVFYN